LITYTIQGCALLNVIGIIGINPTVDKILSSIGLIGMIALLIWNKGEGKNYRAKHKSAAEKYLALHKEIRSCYFLSKINEMQVMKNSYILKRECFEIHYWA
jgi:DMSO reductase anchor subunit